MKLKQFIFAFMAMLLCFSVSVNAQVAKVGNTEYATIDEAIGAWSNNSTLTLLADVTLSDVVTLKSTEHHILDLGTYTMTAASGKDAFVIKACGTGDSERTAITINADATNPGGINAGSKCVVYYKYADGGISGNDRPIIKINGGVFTGSTSSWGSAGIYTIGTAARKCATLNITGGTFNCSINGSGKSKLIVSGGVFNYSVGSQGDSTALRLISGGTFKTFGFMTADSNNTKFWFGTSMGNSNVGVYVDDNGYIVVGGPVNTEAGDKFEASTENYSGASSLLQYSSAKDNGLYYTDVETALKNNTSATVTVYVDELDMAGINFKGTIVVPEGNDITITNAPSTLKVQLADGTVLTPDSNGTVATKLEVATLAELQEALAAENELPIIITKTIVIPEGETVVLDLNGKTVTRQDEANQYALRNLGDLTIKDTKGNGSINARGIYNGYGDGGANVATAKITVLSGTINAKGTNGGAAIFNYGTANVNGGKFTSIGGYSLNNQAGAKMNITDGVEVTGGIYNNKDAELTVDGGNISNNRSGCHTIYAWNAKVTVNGGSIHNENSGNATIMSAGTSEVTINGGTISIKDGRVPGNGNTWTSCLTDAANTAKIIVNGGTFNGGFRVQAGSSMTINGGSFNDVYGSNYNIYGTVTVTGGTFTDATAKAFATKYVAEGYELNEGTVEKIVVAKIGDVEYATLSAAFAAVTDDNQTVVICKDVTENLTATLRGNITTENDDAKVTITLTNSDWVYCPYTFVLGENVTMNVPALFYYAGGAQINGTLVVDAYYQRYAGTKLTINEPGSMTVKSETCILRLTDGDPNAGIYVVGDKNNETIGLKLAVAYFYQGMINAKDANIVAGTYWQTNDTDGQGSANLVLDNSTLTVTVYDHPAKATGNSTVTLTNGSVIDAKNGGFTYGDKTALSVDASSQIIGKNGEVVKFPVASIGDVKYYTLEEAFEAATEGQTITLVDDATPVLQSQRAITKAAVIDLDGKTLTLTEDDLYFGTTTFKNGTIVVDPSVKPSTAVFWMFANQTLTFDKVKVVATGVTGTYLIGLDGNNSDLNLLNGSEILVENTTALDLDIICVNASTGNDIKVENSKVNVTNLDGRVFFRGNYTVKDSEVNLAGITKAGFRIEAGQTLSIEGTSKVNIEGEPRDGGIHLTDATATYTKAETATVNATVNRPSVVQIGENKYSSLADAIVAAKAGDEIVMLADVTLDAATTLPADIIFNGNGKQINGNLIAGGNLTFKGATKVTSFSAGYYNRVITIGEGASLEITGTGRVTLGYGNTFNITGSIENAKIAGKENVQPSLIIPAGISITGGNDATMNVTNAYVKIGSTTSKPGAANGTFTLNFNNSIAEFTKEFGFYDPTGGMNPTFNMNITSSVFTTGTKLCVAAPNSNVIVDNSGVTLGTYFRNSGNVTIQNGSELQGKTIQFGENGGNNGTITVDASSLTVTADSEGHAFDGKGVGKIILKNEGTATLDYVKDMSIETVAGYKVVKEGNTYKAVDATVYVANKSELTSALTSAEDGAIIRLTADIDYGTDQLAIAKAITLDLGGKTLTTRNAWGGMSIKGNPTVKNGTIVHASNTAAIKVWNATAFEDLVIDVQGKGDANKTIGGIVLQSGSTTKVGSIKNVTIKGAALTNGIETYNCGDATENVIGTMENVTIDAQGTGMLISAPCGTATNCDIKGGTNGIEIWIKGNYSASLDLVKSKVEGGVYAHDEFSSNPDVVNNGTLKFTADEQTTGAKAEDVTLTLVRAEENVLGVLKEIVENAQAKVNDTYHATLTGAIAAAKAGDVVTVFEGTYAMPSVKAGITIVGEGNVMFEGTLSGTLENLTMKNIHIKGGNAQRWAYAKGDLVFENVTFEATSVYALHFDGIAAGTNLTYKNCTIIGWAAMGGTPESCVFEGCTIKGNGSYGVIRTYFNATINNCTFDVANVNTNDAYQDGIHAVEGAKVTVTNCTNANGDMTDLVNVHGASVVTVDGVEYKNVAKVDNTYYLSLQAALDAAATGTGNVTVSILADVNLTGVDWNPVTVSAPGYPEVTVEGGNHTITGLNDMLFAGTWAGKSGLIIKNLTIANSTIVNDKDDAKGNVGVGAFIGYPQASATITLENCHLKDSRVEGGHWTGGLIGMAGGYNGTDGPVFMNLTIKGCSVTGSTITGKGSVGGVIGHGSCAAWTNVVIEETTVSNNTITSTGSSNVKAGAVMGTIGAAGQPTTANGETKTGGMSVSATVADNTVKSNGTEITTIYGRQGTDTGMLAVAGGTYDNYPIEKGVAYAAPAAGYKIEQNTDGTYSVIQDPNYIAELVINDAEGKDFVNASEKTVGTLTYTRTLPMVNTWMPLYVPFKISLSEEFLENYDIAYFNDVHGHDDNGDNLIDRTTIELIKISDPSKTIKANYPLVIRALNDDALNLQITMNKATLYPSVENTVTVTSASSSYEIKGTYKKYGTIAENQRVWGKDKNGDAAWGKLKEGSVLNPYRLILTITSRDDANLPFETIRMRVIGEDGEDGITYIEGVHQTVETGDEFIYDLQGRRVFEPTKGGIYIINGKKVYFK